MAFKQDNKKNGFTKVTIGLASPDEILRQSSGEVLKPETINYRTYKPERDGLFCERIFGPSKDYECSCGKYKRIKYKGITCERCGVEVTEKKVRRERMGHIRLVVPIAHIWYLRSLPSKMAALLGIPTKKLEMVIYYEKYIIIQAGELEGKELDDEPIENGMLLDEDQYQEILGMLSEGNALLEDDDPKKFIAKMGAEAIYDMLVKIDLDQLSYDLRDRAQTDSSVQRKTEALKRLNVVESFRMSKDRNRPEWMILKVIPVTPPELRPLVPLDGGRFATSDLNDLYRRVIIRNNRLKRLMEIKAPDVILRNEKRMLQEAVDSLFDNSKKTTAVKSEANRPLKSLSDSLKGKQGRFRQNLLGKRVDYSARSVIVVGPELKMHECGLPKDMAAELYKPFIIRKLIERGIVKTVKSAKKIIDRKDPVVMDILEHVIEGHPVLLNRAPTLHRLGVQAFQPRLIEGKAIQLHPLACTAFNADFDGDQMAVHLPLSNEAILEAQLLMLGSHNILNPANGDPITVPSQDMVLGLYYITKERPGAKGEGLVFYSPDEATIALNEKKVDIHARIKVRMPSGEMLETTPGRLMVNALIPDEVGYVNKVLKKGALKEVIGKVIKACGVARTAIFLDDIKNMGYYMAFKGGLSFALNDIIIPEEKKEMIAQGNAAIEEVMDSFYMGEISDNDRYNKVIGIWDKVDNDLTGVLMKQMEEADQGFNAVYMMMDSGARGSKGQIKQLSGIRGLMAKPQKAGGGDGRSYIENPILSNFKEGMSVLEYFIGTHGARKGLTDTALKTADAGYLTRRLVDVSHDVIITEEDCGTLRGLRATEIKHGDTIDETLFDRILGRVSVHDVYDHENNLIVSAGEEIREPEAQRIIDAGIEAVEIRSVLTCEAKHGVCAKCYGRNLATRKMVQKGEAVGVIAAQAIGEPGTQLTLRTFHSGGVAGNAATENSYSTGQAGKITFEDLRTIEAETNNGKETIVVSRQTELRLVDEATGVVLTTFNIPYASKLFVTEGQVCEKGTKVCEWDPFNATIVIEHTGKLVLNNVIEGVTCKTETDDVTGLKDTTIIESKEQRTRIPEAMIFEKGADEPIRTYTLPVGAHLQLADGEKVKPGMLLVKIPRTMGSASDITGGLPRVTELLEARNPSNQAVVAEIDGEVIMGHIKRGNRELILRARMGEEKKYLIPLTKQILVQEGDYVHAGTALSEGAITPESILAIKGPTAVQDYIVNEVQSVYRLQGVKINDKHFEIIVRQMMRKVNILEAGDTRFLEAQMVDKADVLEENDRIWGRKVVTDAGDSEVLKKGQIVSARRLHDENSLLRRKDRKLVVARDAVCATYEQKLQGITRAALGTKSFISAASFQETTKVLNEAAIMGRVDHLEGMKENVIFGNLIPAGTGLRDFQKIIVQNKEEFAAIQAAREAQEMLSRF